MRKYQISPILGVRGGSLIDSLARQRRRFGRRRRCGHGFGEDVFVRSPPRGMEVEDDGVRLAVRLRRIARQHSRDSRFGPNGRSARPGRSGTATGSGTATEQGAVGAVKELVVERFVAERFERIALPVGGVQI